MVSDKNTFHCPICKVPVTRDPDLDKNSYFPFCSKKCQILDLGAWAREDYRVATNIKPEDLEYGEGELEE